MPTKYRFLPWTRRGLSAEIANQDSGGALPVRPDVSVGITVSNVAPAGVDLTLYGPGDILGVDSRLIVGCSPRPGTTNVEPNYFASIEFDPPDFPWMFTPATASNQQRLRPWLVLIVVNRKNINPPTAQAGQPLPTISIPAEVAAEELPDLSESWAWAHTQVMTGDGPTHLAQAMSSKPDLNVSRLLCPRRLQPNQQYIACLVPAFDAGVTRGLGGEPDLEADLGPAWSGGAVNLPVYYHWEFATGPMGDFESLARKLKPFASPDTVGVTPMYIGDGGPQLPQITPDDERATVMMDGALRAPVRESGTLEDILPRLRQGLTDALNAPSKQLAEGPSDATPALGPPVYGQWHKRQHTITHTMPNWMRELNLDPRARVAAGLGAEVVRKYQEDFMQKCWEQVGEVLKANNRLNWGRLALEAERHLYARHYRLLPPDRLLQMTSPLHRRTLMSDVTVKSIIGSSSMPNAMSDPALRRLTSPRNPMMKQVTRRLAAENRLAPAFRQNMRSTLVQTLAGGQERVDPTRFMPDGLTGSLVADALNNGTIDRVAGIEVQRSMVQTIRRQARVLNQIDFQHESTNVRMRENLRATGLITEMHIDNVRILNQLEERQDPGNLHEFVGSLIETAAANPNASGLLLTLNQNRKPTLSAISLGSDGTVFTRRTPNAPLREIGRLDNTILRGNITIDEVFNVLPPGTFNETGRIRPDISLGGVRDVIMRDTVFGPGRPPIGFPTRPVRPTIPRPTQPQPEVPTIPATNTFPMPVKEVTALVNFERAILDVIREQGFNRPVAEGVIQPFGLAAASKTLVQHIDPVVMVPKRLQQMVKLQNGQLWDTVGAELGIHLTPLFDRVMAAPDLKQPTYTYLAQYEQERFCPGIGVVPPNSITLLETNPRFIESFMVGLNYEMNRELLWREYPTDQRGTPFRHFWDWVDDQPDIQPIHRWPRNTRLGFNTRGAGGGGQIVMLVRGELVRRYPNAVMMAWKATGDGEDLVDPPNANQIQMPVFQGKLDPDVIFAGFSLRDEDLLKDGGWFFIIHEQPTEPRFGFDVPIGSTPLSITEWPDATWAHTGVEPGGYLSVADAGSLTNREMDGLRFGKDSAHMASITLQQPMRVAVHARHLIES